MIWLSDEAIEYAVTQCIKKDRYKVLIVAKATEQIHNIKDQTLATIVRKSHNMHPVGYITIADRSTNYYSTIDLSNGSVIRIVSASEQHRAQRAHLLVVDEEIDDVILDNVFRHIEIMERIERLNRTYEPHPYRDSVNEWIHATPIYDINENTNDKNTEESTDDIPGNVSEEDFINILST